MERFKGEVALLSEVGMFCCDALGLRVPFCCVATVGGDSTLPLDTDDCGTGCGLGEAAGFCKGAVVAGYCTAATVGVEADTAGDDGAACVAEGASTEGAAVEGLAAAACTGGVNTLFQLRCCPHLLLGATAVGGVGLPSALVGGPAAGVVVAVLWATIGDDGGLGFTGVRV